MSDAGILWLQLTGGEPLIDKLFADVYRRAFELGMMLSISSNGSGLPTRHPRSADHPTAVSADDQRLRCHAESYDGLTRRRGSFAKFSRGLAAAHEAGLR